MMMSVELSKEWEMVGDSEVLEENLPKLESSSCELWNLCSPQLIGVIRII